MENGGNDFALLGDSVCPAACPGGAYHGRQAGKYGQLKTFWEKDCDDVLEFAKDLDTSIGLYQSEGWVYLVRNLVDSATYRPWGLLVHRLNLNY